MFGLIIIIVMVIIVWYCIKWWAGTTVRGVHSAYQSLSGANDTVTKSYFTHFNDNVIYNSVSKVEQELVNVKFVVIYSENGSQLPTYTKTQLSDGNYRFDITATNRAHNSLKNLACGQYSLFSTTVNNVQAEPQKSSKVTQADLEQLKKENMELNKSHEAFMKGHEAFMKENEKNLKHHKEYLEIEKKIQQENEELLANDSSGDRGTYYD